MNDMNDTAKHRSTVGLINMQEKGAQEVLQVSVFASVLRRSRLPILSAAAILLAAALTVLQSTPAQPQEVEIVVVDVAAVAHGYQASELIGRRVHNNEDDVVGSIDDLIIMKSRDLIAILQVGGFLGLGGHLVAISFDDLALSDGGKRIMLAGGDREALENLPEFKYDGGEEGSGASN
jgi:hypothetical protein